MAHTITFPKSQWQKTSKCTPPAMERPAVLNGNLKRSFLKSQESLRELSANSRLGLARIAPTSASQKNRSLSMIQTLQDLGLSNFKKRNETEHFGMFNEVRGC